MTDLVDLTLAHWRRTPFQWGQADCMLSVGDYIARRGGVDVTGRFRGRYTTQDEALALMLAHGGASGLIDSTGIERIDGPPQRGDVVVLWVPSDDGGAVGAICTGDSVAARLERTVIEITLRFVSLAGVWRCPR